MTGPIQTGLPDLSDVPLEDLMKLDNPVLREAARRVLEQADHPQEVVAGFQSGI